MANPKISPFLWFDNQAEEAVNFYTSIFNNARITNVMRYGEAGPGPVGEVMTIGFELEGRPFTALNGGPQFSFTPAISFVVTLESVDDVDRLWEQLSNGGNVILAIDEYPFSERYGWIEDRFGVSWQIMVNRESQPAITPSFLFVGDNFGRAEEAITYYTSVFENSELVDLDRFGPDQPQPEGAVAFSVFLLHGVPFHAMESNLEHDFTFTPALSLVIHCQTQDEVDYYWEQLSEGGRQDVCGWLQDRYGVSWQVVPTILDELLQDEDEERAQRVMKAMLGMKKLEIAGLQQAYEPVRV
jgi:predicted 3-demethylubiquinone-9 3-methyltransferase (glyoxalase superfamily)